MSRTQSLLDFLGESENRDHFLLTTRIYDLKKKLRSSTDPETKKKLAVEVEELQKKLQGKRQS